MLLLNLILLIDVTFSTPTGFIANYDQQRECNVLRIYAIAARRPFLSS
jgi:hypothetical protein